MVKYFAKCKICNFKIEPSDLPNDSISIINVYLGKKLINSYCSKKCLKTDFELKEINQKKKFLFFSYNSKKNIWMNKKNPNKHFRVLFEEI